MKRLLDILSFYWCRLYTYLRWVCTWSLQCAY